MKLLVYRAWQLNNMSGRFKIIIENSIEEINPKANYIYFFTLPFFVNVKDQFSNFMFLSWSRKFKSGNLSLGYSIKDLQI